ncbi:hypothetical protein BDV97DRAFT_397475 [Delphinella strobiligena]|nr:hypothetical protein BDV97DRAFT_397475 [Delphinella strobiligena]
MPSPRMLILTPFVTSHYNDSKTIYIEQFIQIEVPGVTSPSPTNGIPTQEVIGNWSESTIQHPVLPDSTFNVTNIPDSYNAPKDTMFSVSGQSVLSFKKVFPIDYTVEYGDGADYHYMENENLDGGSDAAEALFNVTDWDYWIDQFALSMSNNVRQTGDITSNPELYDGEVFSSVSFVRVRWAWLAFPTAMLTGSIIFFVVTVWSTNKQRVRPWKSDPIALLLCSIDETIKERYNMGENIGNQRVLLRYQEQEGIFRKPEKEN